MKYIQLFIILLLSLSCSTNGEKVFASDFTEIKCLYFKPGTFELEDEKELLDLRGRILNSGKTVRIEGYYCEEDLIKNPDEMYLLKIAERRALIVKEKLSKGGIPSKDIFTIAVGKNNKGDRCKVRVLEFMNK